MPGTADERAQFRRKVGGTLESMSDPYVDAVIDEAAAQYAGYGRAVVLCAAWVAALDELIVQAAALTDYQQNQTQEKRSQVAQALERVRARYQGELDRLLSAEAAPAARWGPTRAFPVTRREYPDG